MTKQKKENNQEIKSQSPSTSLPTTTTEYLKSDSFLKEHWWKALIMIVAGLLIYYQTYNYGYVLDDTIVITDNKFTKKGFAGIGDIMTTESMTGYFEEQKNLVQGNRYRPLSLVTFAIEYGIFKKLNPGFSHIFNILLYILSCVVIMRTIQLLIPSKEKIFGVLDFSFLVTMLFLVHPVHVEAVANIKGRDEIMAMLFSMATLYYIVKYYMYGASSLNLFLALFSFSLGLLSKENTITFVAIVPLSLYFFGGNHSKKAWSAFFWLLAISIIYLMFRFSVSGVPKLSEKITDIMNNPFLEMSGMEKIATIIYTLGLYIKLLFIPYPLTHDYYPYAIPIMNFGKWQVLLSTLLYGSIAYFGYKGLRSKNIGSYGILFYLITLTIVSNFVINIGTFMNDRFIYMPSLGFCIFFIWAIFAIGNKLKNVSSSIFSSVFCIVPIVAFAILSFIRVPAWETALTLNQTSLKVSQNSARANSFMSTALFEEAKITEDVNKKKALLTQALPYAKKAIQILPDYYNANLMAVGIAGELHKLDGDIDKLISVFEPCIINRPNIQFTIDYLKYITPNADRNKLVNLYAKAGKGLMNKKKVENIQWGIQFMKMGLEIDPENSVLNKQVYDAFNLLGDNNSARQYLR